MNGAAMARTTPRPTATIAESRAARRDSWAARSTDPAPRSSATRVWAGHGEGIEGEGEEHQQAGGDLVGGEGGRVGAGGDRRGSREDDQHGADAHEQVLARRQQRRHPGSAGASMNRRPNVSAQHDGEGDAGAGLGDHRRPRRSRDAPVEPEDEDHLEHGVHQVGRQQDDQRRAVVAGPPLDALGGQHEQDERHADGGDAQVGGGEVEHVARPTERTGDHRCRQCDDRRQHHAEEHREPDRLDPDVGGLRRAARRRVAGRPARWCRRSGSCTRRRRTTAPWRPAPARRAGPCRAVRRSPCRRARTSARRPGCPAPGWPGEMIRRSVACRSASAERRTVSPLCGRRRRLKP